MDKHYIDLCKESEKKISEGIDEEVLILLNKAININKDNYQAYMIAGKYYSKKKTIWKSARII